MGCAEVVVLPVVPLLLGGGGMGIGIGMGIGPFLLVLGEDGEAAFGGG